MGAVSAVSSGLASIVNVLGSLGVGRKAREKEAESNAKINERQSAKDTQNYIIIGFSLLAALIVGYIIYVNLFKS